MVTRVPLTRVFDNPFQTRTDYNDIEELAESIRALKNVRPETSGLMQVGTARIIIAQGAKGWKVLNPDEYGGVQSTLDDEPDSFVQIAFSHRRLRAFYLLSQTDPDYNTYPLEIIPLTDQQMSDLAWKENAEREDLNPIERAEALQRAIEVFGYTQEALGERWGLAKTTVSNSLRLLKLPTEAQDAIRRGDLTAKHGLALLTAAGKSPTILERAMEAILPPPPIPEEVEETARRLVNQNHFYQTYNLPETAACSACGTSLTGSAYTTGGRFLCNLCHKAGSYTVPSVGEAEKTVKHIISRLSVDLERSSFPLDAQFTPIPDGEGVITWLRSPTCNGCQWREGETCFDGACHELKGKSWKEAQVNQLKARLARDYGIDPEQVTINYGYQGHDLDKNSVDPDLVKVGGPCAPGGGCKRLQFKYETYIGSSRIRVYDDLPFIFQCNHSGAHAAAQKRYQESQKSQAEKTEAVQAAEAATARKAEAKAILDQALTSFAIALRDGHEGAWKALYDTFRYALSSDHKPEPEAGAPGIQLLIAGQVLRDGREALTSKWHDWNREDAVERFQKSISEKLNKYGIVQAAKLADIITKLEKIWEFVYNARLAETITMEQIEGNKVNVGKLVDQVYELHRAGLIKTPADLNRVAGLVRETLDELWEAAGDIEQPLPQDWAMEVEAGLNQLARVMGKAGPEATEEASPELAERVSPENSQGSGLEALKAELEAEIETFTGE